MKLIVNGTRHEHRGSGTLPSLLEELDIDARRVAIMVNDDVISADRRLDLRLNDDDRIEILTFAAGG